MEKHDPDDDVVAIYLREVATNKPLTRDEERRMFQELGNKDDRDETRENIERILIENRLALVVKIAQEHSASGVRVLDLIQQGNLGLMNAVRSFAQRPIGDFSAFATTWIEDAITKALDEPR